MATIKPGKALERVVLNEFPGLRNASSPNKAGASVCQNFRIAPDGSLVKRPGWTTRYQLHQPIRGVWQGTVSNSSYLFVVAGSVVYSRTPGTSRLTAIYDLPSSTGEVSFQMYSGTLYLFDGSSIYRFLESSGLFTVAYGYVPLYGSDWHPIQMGPVNERLNMVYPRIRITYLNSSGATIFNLPFTTRSIDVMKVDGTTVTNYSFTSETSSFQIPSSYAHGKLTVVVTLSSVFSQRSSLIRASRSYLYRTPEEETLLFYGGTGGHRVYYTAPVSDGMLSESQQVYSVGDPLYFPVGNNFNIGDSQYPIHTICRNKNRAIAFSERAIWAIERLDDALVCYPMGGGIGCSAPGGATMLGSDPVTVHSSGVYRMTFPSASSDACVPTDLSDEVSERFPASLLAHGILAWCADRGELWLRDTTETSSGILWVRNERTKQWYTYDNCRATIFFEIDGQVGFGTADGGIVFPDDASSTDDGTPIKATYRSLSFPFSHPETFKRAYRFVLCADVGNATPKLIVQTERYARTFNLTPSQSTLPETFEARASEGKFRVIRMELEINGSSAARVYRLSLLAT